MDDDDSGLGALPNAIGFGETAGASEPVATSSIGVVNYYFPVEVVVSGSLPEWERKNLEARIWQSLSDAMERFA
jgi:hypothetical protein